MSIENFRVVAYGIVLTLLLLLCQQLNGTAAPVSKPLIQTKTLKFPDKELGTVYYIPAMKISDDWTHAKFEYLGKACRDLTVPIDAPLLFKVNYHLIAHPELLSTIPHDAFVEIDFNRMEFGDSICTPLNELVSVQRVNFAGTDITDAGLMKLRNLPNLNTLLLESTNVNGAFISSLSHPEKMHFLKFGDNPLSIKYISDLPRLRNLTRLELCHCKLTNKTLQYVGQMTSVNALLLYKNPQITDDGIKYLKPMNHLHSLYLQDANVTVEGLGELKLLPLEVLKVSGSPGTQDIRKLQKIFPATKIYTSKVKSVTPEIEHLFKPLR